MRLHFRVDVSNGKFSKACDTATPLDSGLRLGRVECRVLLNHHKLKQLNDLKVS